MPQPLQSSGIHIEKDHYLSRILEARGQGVKALEKSQYEFYSQWHYSALRSLLGIAPVDGDFRELAKRLRPAIKPAEARQGMELLEQPTLRYPPGHFLD